MLQIKDLVYRYKKNREETLKGTDFSMNGGQITTLLGPNGAGKTTLLKILTSANQEKGHIFYDGKDLSEMKEQEKRELIAYLPQENGSLSSLSVFEVVLLGNWNHLMLKVDEKQLEHTANILKEFGLENIADKKYSQLSGGQRRIVSIAMTIAKDPKILILDEPTANLDVYNEIEVLTLIKEYVRKKNIIALLVLHSINLASRYSDKICLMKDGRIYKEGTPLETITEENLRSVYHILTEKTITKKGYPLIHILDNEKTTDPLSK
mgnify:CR=1 FL=1